MRRPGTGTIAVSGLLFSNASPGAPATGSVTVSGALQTLFVSVCTDVCIHQRMTDPGGTVSITVNGHTNSVNYGSTANSIASALITQINGDGGAFVWASGPSCADSTDCTIALQARTNGPNYSLSAQGLSTDEADGFTSFDGTSASGAALNGGVYPVTTYDSGTLTVTVNGFQASAPYNQNQNNNAQAMASVLASALNAAGSPVTAVANGTTITITSQAVNGNYTVTGSSTRSFSVSSTTLGGGTPAGGLYGPYITLYSYNTLDNLTQVNQLGDGSQQARVRSFSYDSLSRLLTAQNPESGAISYAYDAAGNVLTKTSPAPNQQGTATEAISYCYDVLNRMVAKGYALSPASPQTCSAAPTYLPTPSAVYTYDTGAYGIGHLSSLTDQAGSGIYGYDPLGRMVGEQRTIAGISKSMSYVYNLDGSVASLTYPSNATVTYTPDSAGHMLKAVDTANGINYTTSATYAADGSLASFVSGASGAFAGITNSFSYNKRLQPVNMSASSSSGAVFSLNYDFHLGAGNNGNVWAITNNKDNSRNQTFTYDALNRLGSAHNAGTGASTDCSVSTVNGKNKYWGNLYTYDAWGNLLSKGGLPGSPSANCPSESLDRTVDAQNRLHVKAGADYQYDAAGNMTYDAVGQYYSYDQENRITGANGFAYTYDADGNRVEKSNGSTGTLYWYMSPGIVAESDLSGNLQSEYVFFDGERVARRDNPGSSSSTVSYYFSDHLKTTDVVTDAQGNIKNESDFYPWGGELQFVANDSNHYKFTGKERDNETGLDYFGARYYSNGLGRFITPDWAIKQVPVPYGDFSNPQTLNLYRYPSNPETYADLDGHSDWWQAVKSIFNQSVHKSEGSAEVSAGSKTESRGALTVSGRAGTVGTSGQASASVTGVAVSGEVHGSVASTQIKVGNVSTTDVKAVSADASANAKLSLNPQQGVGVSIGGKANADVVSGSETIELGRVTVGLTGNVGVGAEGQFSLTQEKFELNAGFTPLVGGTVKVSIKFGPASASAGASGNIDHNGKTSTDVQQPKVKVGE